MPTALENEEIEEARSLVGGPGDRQRRTASSQQAAAQSIISSYFSRKFFQGVAVLFPIVVSAWAVYWFIEVLDSFFSPLLYYFLGWNLWGFGAVTSILFIFATGVFASSWAGGALVNIGDYLIRKLPLVKQIYNGAKQITTALNPAADESSNAFRECVIIKHPRIGEHAIGFVTGHTQLITQDAELSLVSVYVPTNHVYVGDVFLLQEKDIIRCQGLDINTGLQILVSTGIALPPKLYTASAQLN